MGYNINLRYWNGVKILNNIFGQSLYRNINISGGSTDSDHASNIIISGNKFDSTNILGDSNLRLIQLENGTKVDIKGNIATVNSSSIPFVYINTSKSSVYSYKDNTIITTLTSGVKQITASNLSLLDPSAIYGVPFEIFVQASAAYAALTSQAVTIPIQKFNALFLIMHKTNGGDQVYEETIRPWVLDNKLELHRWYNYYYENTGGDKLQGRIATNNDGTISYESSTTNLTLREVIGINM